MKGYPEPGSYGLEFSQVDHYLPEKVRHFIEQHYYAKVNEQAKLDVVARDESFLKDPVNHVALYTDHGVVHVRDVARNILVVIDAINGVLIPKKTNLSLNLMKGYGVMMAYNHDIGMREFSDFGRYMHPEFAAQEVFSPAYDEVIEILWDENCGNVAWHLLKLTKNGALEEKDPKRMLREMLAMSLGHSKAKMPIEVLNNPQRLRSAMMRSVSVDLHYLYHEQQVAEAERKLARARENHADATNVKKFEINLEQAQSAQVDFLNQGMNRRYEGIQRHYTDFDKQAFQWIVADHPDVRSWFSDVVDTVRALRTADALRQRGTVLKTSGSYQIFVDQNTANAIYALQKGSGELFFLELDKAINAGEANIASSELTPTGDLRIACNRGSFSSPEATQRGAYNMAFIIDEIQQDILDTFQRPAGEANAVKPSRDIRILIENTDDNLEFAEKVLGELGKIDPLLVRNSCVVPSLKNIAPDERDRYLDSQEIDWKADEQQKVLARVAQSGHKVRSMDPARAFTDVRLTKLKGGETLIHAGAPPGFVYIPMNEGLLSTPLGGYQAVAVKPWIPLGNIRVIRDAEQEAAITAEKAVELIMIPKETYLKYWHDAYDAQELIKQMINVYHQSQIKGFDQVLNILSQVALINKVIDDVEIECIRNFIQTNGFQYSDAQIRVQLLKGPSSDWVSLRQSVVDYIALDPPYFQAARLHDLLNLLVKADGIISAEEDLSLSEFNETLSRYLEEDKEAMLYKVFIITQNEDQHQRIRDLLPKATEVVNFWGKAYFCGAYYAKDYADMAVERYRKLKWYAIIEQETPKPGAA